jgi:hypothetical protein
MGRLSEKSQYGGQPAFGELPPSLPRCRIWSTFDLKNLLRGPLDRVHFHDQYARIQGPPTRGGGGILATEFGALTSLNRLGWAGTISVEQSCRVWKNDWSFVALYERRRLDRTAPTELGNLVNMTRFTLSDCMLTDDPLELGRMTILEDLTLDKNDFTAESPKRCALRLRELNVRYRLSQQRRQWCRVPCRNVARSADVVTRRGPTKAMAGD